MLVIIHLDIGRTWLVSCKIVGQGSAFYNRTNTKQDECFYEIFWSRQVSVAMRLRNLGCFFGLFLRAHNADWSARSFEQSETSTGKSKQIKRRRLRFLRENIPACTTHTLNVNSSNFWHCRKISNDSSMTRTIKWRKRISLPCVACWMCLCMCQAFSLSQTN